MQTSIFVQNMQRHAFMKRKAPRLPVRPNRKISISMPMKYGQNVLVAG